MRRYQRLIYTVARRGGLGDDAAADVFQTCFERLLAHLDRIDDATKVRAWLVTTARRETLRVLSEKRRRAEVTAVGPTGDNEETSDPLADVAAPDALPEELLSDLQQHHVLRQAVDALDPRSRQFVELVFLSEEPPPYHEIAARLGIAEGSIGPTRARCLQKLRNILATLG